MSNVLIIDSMFKQNLAAVRSLGRKGVKVTVLDYTTFCAGALSKYSKKRVICPNCRKDKKKFIKFLIKHLQNNKYDAVFPFSEDIIQIFYEYKDKISKYANVLFSSKESFDIASDKLKTMKLAKELKIPIPHTFEIISRSHLKKISDEITYPVILKASKSSGSRGIKVVNNRQELLKKYDKLRKLQLGEIFYQDYLPVKGSGWGVGVLCSHGQPLTNFVYKRLKEFPSNGGPSALRISAKNQELLQYSFSILKKLKWNGIAHIEFKKDTRNGQIKLLEINPRFWGSIQTAIDCGVDFPYLLYQLCTNKKIELVKGYKTGIIGRDFFMSLAYLMSSKQRFKELKEFFQRGVCDDILSKEDPMGVIGYIALSLEHLFDFKSIKSVFLRKK